MYSLVGTTHGTWLIISREACRQSWKCFTPRRDSQRFVVTFVGPSAFVLFIWWRVSGACRNVVSPAKWRGDQDWHRGRLKTWEFNVRGHLCRLFCNIFTLTEGPVHWLTLHLSQRLETDMSVLCVLGTCRHVREADDQCGRAPPHGVRKAVQECLTRVTFGIAFLGCLSVAGGPQTTTTSSQRCQ